MRRFFIGGSPELEDPTYPQKPAMADVRSLLNIFGHSGYLVIKL